MGLKLFKKKKSKKVEKEAAGAGEQNQNDYTEPTDMEYPDAREDEEHENENEDENKVVSGKDQGKYRPSDVYDTHQRKNGYKHKRSQTVPSARDAAYTGPPRYDWIDVESSAAIKIQSIFRRNQCLNLLEEEGKSTAAMRNRIRSRQADTAKHASSEDVPTIFRFCGIGLLFGEVTGEDNDALNSNNTGKDKIAEKEKKESIKRRFRFKKKKSEQVEEAIEVVENVDEY